MKMQTTMMEKWYVFKSLWKNGKKGMKGAREGEREKQKGEWLEQAQISQ